MKTYVRKTHDVWIIEGYHSGKWSQEITSPYASYTDREKAKETLRAYKGAFPRTAFRIVKRRVPNEKKGA